MQMYQHNYETCDFGNLCKTARARFEMTRPEMARKLGVSPITISEIESGKMPPPSGYVCAATGLLGLSTTDVKAALASDAAVRDSEDSMSIGR